MGFGEIPQVPQAQDLLEVAFKRAATRSAMARTAGKKYETAIKKARAIEQIRLDNVKDTLNSKLSAIGEAFPKTDNLTVFYEQLIKCTLDFTLWKQSLGSLKWAEEKIKYFTREYLLKIRKCEDARRISDYRRAAYGRISSVIKQIKRNLEYLEECRKVMRDYPVIKQLPTVAVAGFPNVGKTTLLYKLTGSKAEIAPYAFTTKNINVGYIKKGETKIQVLDTPGTLNRFDRMNNIERIAYLAMKLVADKIVYIFDPIETYPMEHQEKLYEAVERFGKKMLIYISKSDIAAEPDVEAIKKKFKGVTDAEQIKAFILADE